jgi:hypothetical protein
VVLVPAFSVMMPHVEAWCTGKRRREAVVGKADLSLPKQKQVSQPAAPRDSGRSSNPRGAGFGANLRSRHHPIARRLRATIFLKHYCWRAKEVGACGVSDVATRN